MINFYFSVIIAAHNSDLYLKKAFDSVISQSLDFVKKYSNYCS